jgi:DNA-binding IclR family transcriptional regulator
MAVESCAGAQAIGRAAALLRAISRGPPAGRRLKDLATATGLVQPTAHRILQALAAEGLVAQDGASRRYRIGQLTYELATTEAPNCGLRSLARTCGPHVRELAELTGDSIYLSLRSGVDTICLDRAEGSFPIRAVTVEVGGRLPLGVGTGGVALLAAAADSEIEEVLDAIRGEVPVFNELRLEEIRERVRATRRTGFADIVDKPVAGMRGIGRAIATAADDGPPRLAIAIAAVRDRLPDRRLPEIHRALTDTAGAIAAELARPVGARPVGARP